MFNNQNSQQPSEVKGFGCSIIFSKNRRPRLQLPFTKLEVFLQVLAAGSCLALVAIFLATWQQLPDIIPTNFDFYGNPNAWGSKNTVAFIMALGLLLYAGMTALSRYPHVYNYVVPINHDNAADQYTLARQLLAFTKLIIVAMFAYLNYAIYTVAVTPGAALNNIIMLAFVVALLGGLGAYIYLSIRLR